MYRPTTSRTFSMNSGSAAFDSSVIVTTRSTSASLTVRGAPGLGSSRRPSHPFSMNRRRHLPTVSRVVPSRAATPMSLSPSADASTIRARGASACPVLDRRSQRSSSSRCPSSISGTARVW